MYIIKVGSCYVGGLGLVDQPQNARKWRAKKDANAEAIFWIGSYYDGASYSVAVIPVPRPDNKSKPTR